MGIYRWVAIVLLLCAGTVWGQAEGEVESIGFLGSYRPECWTPMLIRLTAKTDTATSLQIRVYQQDMDRDRMVAVKNISLTPAVDGRGGDQRFWMYFRPQPVDDGLSDPASGGSRKTLEQQLKVVLCDSSGRPIAPLHLTQATKRVDLLPQAAGRILGTRMVLCVSEGIHQPTWREYQLMEGLSETPEFVTVRSSDLPEDVRGYEAVDAIVWLNAPAPDPHRSTDELKYRAIEEYVRQGGMLVVCQGAELAQTRGFADILPVTDIQTCQTDDLTPLPQMARQTGAAATTTSSVRFRVAQAQRRPDAQVELYKSWPAEGRTPATTTPYLARRPLGMGCVTWVAQDLSEPALERAMSSGWSRVWDTVLGWRNDPMRIRGNTSAVTAYSDNTAQVDLGRGVLRGQSMSLRVSAYVLLSVGFFVAYWVLAGPVATMVLGARKLSTFNWFAFGAIALAAAGLSLLVTKLVQSQSARLDHITLVRVPREGPAVVQSRIGLYVPSDGTKRLEIRDFEPRTVNWITPFPIHPYLLRGGVAQFLAMKEYNLPIEDAATSAPVRLDMPWRSTEKRLETHWTGRLEGRIEGKASFTNGVLPELYGVLTNQTGITLQDVYLVYSAPSPPYAREDRPMDRVVYIPRWRAGDNLELAQSLDPQQSLRIGRPEQLGSGTPGGSDRIVEGLIEPVNLPYDRLRLREGWVSHWYSDGRLSGNMNDIVGVSDSMTGYRTTLPMLSLMPRIPPMRNSLENDKTYTTTRRDLLRLNGRAFDVSSAVAAGNLVVLAHAEGPMPVPLEVDGEKVTGSGVVFYQFVLPLDRK